jgi:hypothetical protein
MAFYLTSLILHKDTDMKLSSLMNQTLLGLSCLCLMNTVQAQMPVWSFTPIGSPVVTVSATSVASVSYTVRNNSSKPHQLMLSSTTPSGISQLGGPCVLAARSAANPTPTCTLTLGINGSALPANNLFGGPSLCQINPNGTPNPNQCYQPDPNDVLVITRTTAPGATTLNTSISPPSILALSVKNTALNAALTGNARQITITNTGTNETSGLSVSTTGLPAGTNITTVPTTCTGTLAPGATCTVTITPGSNATSDCNTGIVPTPGTITVSATNVATPATSNVVVLSYGCQYQGGFLYAVDDTTVNTGNIGGKVATLVDQAAPLSNSTAQTPSIIWSSNGNGAVSADVNYTAILGINDTSTPLNPSPTSPPYPSGTPAYTPCYGASDGACDSSNIVSYYNFNRTSGGSAPTPLNYYAAGLCTATINSYSNWYLPAICEMDAVNSYLGLVCPTGMQSMTGSLAFLIGDPSAGTPSTSCSPPNGTNCLTGAYWSSTQYSETNFPTIAAWYEIFNATGTHGQSVSYKLTQVGVRCSRALTI